MHAYDIQTKNEYLNLGLILSALVHIFLFYQIYLKTKLNLNNFNKKVIYSITIDSGKDLGGISQVPDLKKKTEVAPPKKTAPPAVEEEKDQSKEKDVVIPNPSVKATPKPTAKPMQKESPKPSKKPTAKPTKKPTKKPTPKPPKKKNYSDALQKYLGESTDAGGSGFGSAQKGSGTGMGGGVIKSPEWHRYKNALMAHVRRGWNWHDQTSQLYAEVYFEIMTDGSVKNVRLVKSSGNSKYDDSVMRAVKKANPVPVPSAEIYPDFKQVVIDFAPTEY